MWALLERLIEIIIEDPPRPTPVAGDHAAVLLIDMQDHFVRQLDTVERARIIAGQCEIIRQCAARDIPLLVIELVGFGETLDILKKDIEKVLRTIPITKSGGDAFYGSDLEQELRSLARTTLILMGVNASCCVLDTAFTARALGFNVLTADNLIADDWRYHREWKRRDWYEKNGTFFETPIVLT